MNTSCQQQCTLIIRRHHYKSVTRQHAEHQASVVDVMTIYTWFSSIRVSGQSENSILHLINFINTTIFFFFLQNIHYVFQKEKFNIMKVIAKTKVRHKLKNTENKLTRGYPKNPKLK